MADRFPLILNTSANQIQEIASGDSLDLTNTNISNAGIITASSFSGPIVAGAGVSNITSGIGTFTDLRVGGDTSFSEDFVVTGNARVTGILTVGTSSIILNDSTDTIKVGTALTLGHTQGLQFHTQNLHSAGFDVNQINVSGASTIGGNLDANGDLDVDGHTNLDNVSIAGVVTATTFVGALTGNATGLSGNPSINVTDLDVDGHTNLDNVSISGITTISGTAPNLLFTETDANPDWGILCSGGQMKFQDMTNTANILTLDDDKIQAVKNLDALAGIDVTGNLIASGNLTANNGTVTVSGTAPKITFTETNDNPDYKLEANGGNISFVDTTNSVTRLSISSSGINVTGDGTFSGNVSIGGTLTYEDVTNIDSVGIVTARLGVSIPDDTSIFLGNSNDLSLKHINSGTYNLLHASNGYMQYRASAHFINDEASSINFIRCENKGVKLAYNGSNKLTTEASGVNITGVCTATTFVGALTGNATSSDTVDISGAGNANTEFYVTFSDTNGAAKTIKIDDGLRYNASSNILTASYFSGNGANLSGLNGSNIASGTVPVARIGTGTKSASTFYRGDGTFATVTAPAITGLSNASNNRVLTSEGGTTVNAEANLEFDGTNLFIGPNYVPKLSSGADNRVTTATGANAIQGETNLKFDGTHLAVGAINPGEHYYSRGIACHAAGTGSVLHLTDNISGSGQSNGFDVISHDGDAYLWQRETGNMIFGVGGQSKWSINNAGDFFPSNNGTQDIGSSGARVQNIYTNDLHLSNEGSTNSVDNTWGDYTIQEGESDLFLINNRSGKKYKFNLTEVS